MSQSYPKSSLRPKRKISEEFTLKGATALGGYNLLADYLDSIGFSQVVSQGLQLKKAWWANYPLASMVEMLVEGFACGLERIFHFEAIAQDPLMTHKRGLQRLPDHTLFNKDLKRFDSEERVDELRTIQRDLTRPALKRRRPWIFDFDSTVETVYGEQEGSAVGYNPQKHGRSSYQPLLCYEGAPGLCLNAQLQAGNTHSAGDAVHFLLETLAMYPGRKRLARLDRGFDSHDVMESLEVSGCRYVLKLRLTQPLLAALATLSRRRWKRVPEEAGTEVAELRYRAGSWTRERRVVVRRRRLEDSAQEDFWGLEGYEFAAYVTTLRWAPVDIVRFYDHRGTAENYIKESKAGFAIDHIPTGEFYPNWAALVLKLIAYNLLLRFQRALYPKAPVRRTAATFRRWFLRLPAQLINRSGQWVLKLPEGFPHPTPWIRLRTKLAAT